MQWSCVPRVSIEAAADSAVIDGMILLYFRMKVSMI